MSLKTWMLSSMNRVFTRADLPPRDAVARTTDAPRVEPMLRPPGTPGKSGDIEHLGRYGPLIGAIREEFEDFVASHLRLHLAIAERDRYLLTSIEVESTGSEDARELLFRFTREFTPEQVKHYLAREVIARLPNANAIDLAQFAGLTVEQPGERDEGPYDDLMNELRSSEPGRNVRPYQVTLVGRWCEGGVRGGSGAVPRLDSPTTPLAGRDLVIDVEDAGGKRRVELTSITPGRRYVIGKDEGCDIVVKGVYASRRHCELWLERGAWWITDSGSTNGIRVEPPPGALAQPARPRASIAGDGAVLEVPADARVVLSASAEGRPIDYPCLALRAAANTGASTAAAPMDLPSTPVTPIVVPARAAGGLVLTARMASGTRMIDVPEGEEPLRVGRSRNQALVVDWAHQGVSGHHIDILDRDAFGAAVVVHGDNGVTVDGTSYAAGARFRWGLGQTMILGRPQNREPECALTLSRRV
jgi:pSer/pThr/pTyr-binding forkhead associated (FHA) protein